MHRSAIRILVVLTSITTLWQGSAPAAAATPAAAASAPLAASTAHAADDDRSDTNRNEATEGFDRRLSGYAYPYPVERFELSSQRQSLEMAYMDVRPDEPNGDTVLLLHGKNFSGAYWKTTIEALTADGYRVVAPDQIGFGKSSKPRHYQFSFHALATNTKALLEAIGVDRTAVVGHSMGGMLATRFALMYPDTAVRLALVNPIGLEDWKAKGVPYRDVETLYRRELAKTPTKIKAYMTESYFDGTWKDAYDPLLAIQAGWTRGPDWEHLAWISALTYDMVYTQPVVHELPRVTQPTLLIIGTRDRTALGKGLVPPGVREKLGQYQHLGDAAADAIPDARLVELDGIGHIPHYEAFERYIEALRGFLE